ncbi:hypothetical protein [Acinetobacter sp. NPDC052428]|uniref:hypothetical protein n=1 Tax=Acinetobacter sp. NPDC052428 TaxID=3363890 RepID=UPI0037C689F7
MNNESEKFFSQLIHEIDILLDGEDQQGKTRFRVLVDLRKTLQDYNVPEVYFSSKRDYLNDFKRYIFSYNQKADSVYIEMINERAKQISTYLINTQNKKINENIDIESKNIIKLEKTLSTIKNQQEQLNKEHSAFLKNYEEMESIFADLKNKNSAFSQLIDEQSNSQIGQLYRDIYNREIDIADQYRNWALGIFAIVGIILVLGFLNISIQNWNHLKDSSYIHIPLGWESLIKTLMLFSLTTPAWYLARESSKHRKVAYKAQMLGTELASFPLYAREFKDEERLELRKHLADRFFGQELYNDSKTNSNSDNSLEQVKLLTEANKVLAESLKIKKSIEGG